MALDILTFRFLYSIAERLSFFNFVFVAFAVYLPWILVLFALWLLLGEKETRARVHNVFFTLLVAVVSRGIIAEAFRFFVSRERPYAILGFKPLFEVASTSFPSGHAALLFAIAFAMWHVRREWAAWFFVGAAVNACARIMAGVHWPSDVVAGFLVALVSYFAVKCALRRRGEPETTRRVV